MAPHARGRFFALALAFALCLAGLLVAGCTVVGFDTPYNKGVDAYQTGDLPAAAEHFRIAVEKKPEFYEAWYNLARVYDELARARMQLAARREAELQREAVARTAGVAPAEADDANAPDEPVIAATPAELRELARQDYEKAAAAYRRALEINPSGARALVSYAMFRYEQGEEAEALQLLERAVVAQSDRAWPLATLGLYFQRQGRRAEALAAYRRALAREPRDPLTHFRLGTWFEDGGDLQSAQAHYELAVDGSPEDPLYWRQLGYVYLARNEPIRGARALEQSMEYDSGSAATLDLRVEVWLDIARAYASADWHERAVFSLWHARDLRPDDPEVARLLLDTYRALQRQETARLLEAGADVPPANDGDADTDVSPANE